MKTEKDWLRFRSRLNRKLETFADPAVRRKYEIQAMQIAKALDRIERLLGKGAQPMFWAADRDWRSTDETFEDHYLVHADKRSDKQLCEWMERGGRLEWFPGPPGTLIIVRLISVVEGHSCFGVEFDTKNGRCFEIIENEVVRNSEKLRARLKGRGVIYNGLNEDSLEFNFRDAICQLVLPKNAESVDGAS